jgi:hypothetical protein
MQAYSATAKGPLKADSYIDKDDITAIQIFWGAPLFAANTVYRLGDIIRPTVDTGYYHECTKSGKSSTEPTWTQTKTTAGTAVFTAVSFDLWVLPEEALEADNVAVPPVPASAWAALDVSPDVTTPATIPLASAVNDTVSSSVFVGPIPSGVTVFELTNRARKSNGETLSRTLQFKVHEQ